MIKPLRALVFGGILWLLIFFEVTILTIKFGLVLGDGFYYLIHFILLILFTLLCSLAYFWVPRSRGGFGQGLFIGFVFVLVLVILDLLITVPFFVKDIYFLVRPDILVGELVIFVLCILSGLSRK